MAVSVEAVRAPAAFESGAGEWLERWALLCLHRDRVVRLVCARGVAVEDAEDSVHDAMLQVAMHPALDNARAGSLLTVVAVRRAADRHRSRGREARALCRAGCRMETAAAPDEAALDRVEAEWLAGQVRRLPLRQRGVVAGSVAGYSTGETAEHLGITAKAVESALARARLSLRATLAAAGALSLTLLRRLHDTPAAAPLATAVFAVALVGGTAPSAHRDAATSRESAAAMRVVSVARAPFGATAHGGGASRNEHRGGMASRAGTSGGAPGVPSSSPPMLRITQVGGHATAGDDGASMHRYHGDETFTQSLQACLSAGVSLDPGDLGCPPQ